MSDPVTNLEIEDVLSSIRRLVSEEGRSEARAEVVKPARSTDRLVLTPALRVAESLDEDDPETAEPVAETAPSDSADPVDLGDEPWTVPDATLYEAAQAASADPYDEEYSAKDHLEDSISGSDEALSASVEWTQAEPDQELDVEDLTPDEQVISEPENETSFSEVDVAEEASFDADPEPASADPIDSLSAKIQALEAAIGRTPDQWEPDGESDEDYSGTRIETIAWQDHEPDVDALEEHVEPTVEDTISEREIAGIEMPDVTPLAEVEATQDDEAVYADDAPAASQNEADEDGDRDILMADDTILDEESLRELVADIVRQELQGALGERITRNVRKLVRREIHRALTAQELE
jgi:hypothetical protein